MKISPLLVSNKRNRITKILHAIVNSPRQRKERFKLVIKLKEIPQLIKLSKK